MEWNQLYTKAQEPTPQDFDRWVVSPYWRPLREWIEETYGAAPKVEHSCCSFAPGWNMKYRKGGRSLCTLYPGIPTEDAFTALVVIGPKEADRAEALLLTCDPYLQKLYRDTAGESKWLMAAVTSRRILEDVEALLTIRSDPTKKGKRG